MARTGITKDQVFEVAREIRDEGGTVTIAAVRGRLGNTGSFSTYSRHLAEWRRKESPENKAPPTPASVETIARRLWSEAWRLASESLEAAGQQWDKEKKHLELELHNLAIELDQSKKAFDEAMKSLMEKTLEIEHLKIRYEEACRDQASSLERARQLERSNAVLTQKLASSDQEIARLKGELDQARHRERQALDEAAKLKGSLEAVQKTGGKSKPAGRKKS